MSKKKIFYFVTAIILIIGNISFAEEENAENTTYNNDIDTSVVNSLDETDLQEDVNVVNEKPIIDEEKIDEKIDEKNDEKNDEKKILTEDINSIQTEEKKIENMATEEFVVEENDIDDEIVENPCITYKTHIQNIGWQEDKRDSETSGTVGKSLRIEAMTISVSGFKDDISIKYQAHVQNVGWQSWKSDGELAGTVGKGLRLEGLKIRLESTDEYSVMYRAHVENIGWQDWRYDGELAGTEGMSYRIEAIQIKIVKKIQRGKVSIETPENGVKLYNKNTIEVVGWKMSNVINTKINAYFDDIKIDEKSITYTKRNDLYNIIYGYGTSAENPEPGYKFSIDTINAKNGTHTIKVEITTVKGEILGEITSKIELYNDFHISYAAHVQNVGWQKYINSGELSGTEGRALRLEALKINLVNAPKDVKVKYRAHVQNIGWQNWESNNSLAGTEGKSLRVEAIQIKLEGLDEFTVEYQVHIQDIGWSQWYIDGEIAGTVGQSKRIEAVRIRLVPKYKRRYVGVDVSVFNGSVDWSAVKKSGIDFVMVRVGYRGYGATGTLVEDSRFKENVTNAKKAGIKVGVYFVTQAISESEAIEEANWVIDKIKSYKIDYPVAMDVEYSSESNHNGRADKLDKNTRTAVIRRFCDKIQNAGYIPMIYLNVDWAYNFVNMSQLSNYDTWIANYRNNPNLTPSYKGNYTIWQYTSTGSVGGISGVVDCNICYKKY